MTYLNSANQFIVDSLNNDFVFNVMSGAVLGQVLDQLLQLSHRFLFHDNAINAKCTRH
jgi:F0F1-type ATP synthase assembly protein I